MAANRTRVQIVVVTAAILTLIAMLPLAYGPGTQPALANDPPPDDSSAVLPVTMLLAFDSPPHVGQPRTLTASIVAADTLENVDLSVTVPGHYSFLEASPPGYAVVADSYRTTIEWSALTLTETVTDTMAITTVSQLADGFYHDVYATAFISGGIHFPAGALIWAKDGQGATPGAVTDVPPENEVGGPNEISSEDLPQPPSVSAPEEEPVSVGLKCEPAPSSNELVTATVAARNTVSVTVPYSWVLTLPAGWQVVSGDTSYVGSLQPLQQDIKEVVVMPSVISGTWHADLDVGFAQSSVGDVYSDIHVEQAGVDGWLGAQGRSRDWGATQDLGSNTTAGLGGASLLEGWSGLCARAACVRSAPASTCTPPRGRAAHTWALGPRSAPTLAS